MDFIDAYQKRAGDRLHVHARSDQVRKKMRSVKRMTIQKCLRLLHRRIEAWHVQLNKQASDITPIRSVCTDSLCENYNIAKILSLSSILIQSMKTLTRRLLYRLIREDETMIRVQACRFRTSAA